MCSRCLPALRYLILRSPSVRFCEPIRAHTKLYIPRFIEVIISKIIIGLFIYMKLQEPMLYLGKDKCKHSTACWGEAAGFLFSLRYWMSSSVPCCNICINCISNSWVFFQAILSCFSLQGLKTDTAHSWQGNKPTHCGLWVQYSGVQVLFLFTDLRAVQY